MKNFSLIFTFLLMISFSITSCREPTQETREIEIRTDDVVDDIQDSIDDVGDEIEDAVDEVGDAIN